MMKSSEHDIQAAAVDQYRMRGTANSVLFEISGENAPQLFACGNGEACFVYALARGSLSTKQQGVRRRIETYANTVVIVTVGLPQLLAALERRGVLRSNAVFINAA